MRRDVANVLRLLLIDGGRAGYKKTDREDS
jgi:hypothetical protein